MKIKNIKINQFGKLKNKEINLENNINIIYGKNEAGKSTLLKFIAGMFYGISKNKNGKEISDFEQYEPWHDFDFSGKISYELDNGKNYEIYRDFRKKNPKIYNENSEDISKEYSVDKNKGSEFFKEQTGMEEELFYHTILAQQEKMKLNEQEQNNLIQKMTNLISTGNDTISYKKTMEKLKNKLLDEVGTDRTTERPINKVEEKLKKLVQEYKMLEEINDKKYEFDEIEKNIKNKIKNQEKLISAIKEIKKIKEEQNIEEEIIRINKNSLQELEEKKAEIATDVPNCKKRTRETFFTILLAIIAMITALLFALNKIKIINYLFLFAFIIYGIYFISIKIKQNKIKKNEIEEKIKQKKEKEIIEENIKNKKSEIENIINKLNEKINKKENEIKKYYSDINLNYYFNQKTEQIKIILENEEEKNSELKLKWHEIQIDKKSIISQTENMAQVEEEIKALEEEKRELSSLSTSIQIARQTIEEAYDEMKNSLTPQFTCNLSKTVENISSKKYKNVKFNDEDGLLVELENGEYKKAERLSTGTIFQMYLSLRLAVAKEITNESMPIILDEAFVYYDDERLENILEYLAKNYKNEQIILFTCSNREKEIFEKINEKYNYIEI